MRVSHVILLSALVVTAVGSTGCGGGVGGSSSSGTGTSGAGGTGAGTSATSYAFVKSFGQGQVNQPEGLALDRRPRIR